VIVHRIGPVHGFQYMRVVAVESAAYKESVRVDRLSVWMRL